MNPIKEYLLEWDKLKVDNKVIAKPCAVTRNEQKMLGLCLTEYGKKELEKHKSKTPDKDFLLATFTSSNSKDTLKRKGYTSSEIAKIGDKYCLTRVKIKHLNKRKNNIAGLANSIDSGENLKARNALIRKLGKHAFKLIYEPDTDIKGEILTKYEYE